MLTKYFVRKKTIANITDQRGQAAIFIALIFQVLFVFFAMVINVGLLVHQKINLQNAVDLGAYYGAMKQAENLNAIAHMNYQIRQAWKLLIFRYQQIGSAGDDKTHPFNIVTKTITYENDDKEYPRANFFCYAYDPFDPYSTGQTYCNRDLKVDVDSSPIQLGGASSLFGNLGGFANFDQVIINLSQILIGKAMTACEQISGLNWFGLARYITAYKMDLANRKKSIYLVANGMSRDTDDFLDLDGDKARDGIEKTIKKNLTPENRANYDSSKFKIYNSLGHPKCKSIGADSPPQWLVETNIYPTFYFVDTDCKNGNSASVGSYLKIINMPGKEPNYKQGYEAAITALKDYIYEPKDDAGPAAKIYKSALGFEKDPWCMAYVEVEAESTPNIPFSPLGNVKMKAKAYAKPFGGKIGPWYGKFWPRDASPSRSDHAIGNRIDSKVPDRVGPGEAPDYSAAQIAMNLQPNYSRYVGDNLGTRSMLTTAHFGKAIHSMGRISYAWWDHLVKEDLEEGTSSGDPLAWDSLADKSVPMRDLEIAAIAPDNFDLNYYSVEPDFYRNYLTRLNARQDKGKLVFRGDLGSRRKSPDPNLLKFGVKDQVAVANRTTNPPIDAPKLTYLVTKFYSLLNSWQSKDQESYNEIDTARFGKCGSNAMPPDQNPSVVKDNLGPEFAIPGNCMDGGRVGYSVKLVDETHLFDKHSNLGGENQDGKIRNSPGE